MYRLYAKQSDKRIFYNHFLRSIVEAIEKYSNPPENQIKRAVFDKAVLVNWVLSEYDFLKGYLEKEIEERTVKGE